MIEDKEKETSTVDISTNFDTPSPWLEEEARQRVKFRLGESLLAERLLAIQKFVEGPAALSEITGITPSGIKGWIYKGAQPGVQTMKTLSDKTGISMEYIASGEIKNIVDLNCEEFRLNIAKSERPVSASNFLLFEAVQKYIKNIKAEISNLKAALEINRTPSGFVELPYLHIQASAGNGRLLDYSMIEKDNSIAFKDSWLKRIGLSPSNCKIITAVGDSMEPTIRDGDLLIVDTNIETVLDNGIYVVIFNEFILVKRVQVMRDGSLALRSDNQQSGLRDEVVTVAEAESFRVAGRVRWYGRAI